MLNASALFFHPWITHGLPASMAPSASRATSAEDIAPGLEQAGGPLPATDANSVAVAPGRLTVAVTRP